MKDKGNTIPLALLAASGPEQILVIPVTLLSVSKQLNLFCHFFFLFTSSILYVRSGRNCAQSQMMYECAVGQEMAV